MEEDFEEYDGDPNQFEEFSGELDMSYIKEFAVILGMHPIRDQRLLWWAEDSRKSVFMLRIQRYWT
jgi:hypothetical protein